MSRLRRLRRLRSALGARRWTFAALGALIALTTVFGMAAPTSAHEQAPARPDAPMDGPNIFDDIRARFCGTTTAGDVARSVVGGGMTPIGLPLTIVKYTGFCNNAGAKGENWVYCNGTSLLGMIDPANGPLGNPRRPDGSLDPARTYASVMSGPLVKFWVDQLNGNWYYLPKAELEAQGLGWYYEEARKEAVDRGNCALVEHLPDPSCEVILKMPKEERRKHLRDGLLPDDCVGTYPTANYNISYDGGGPLSVDRRIWGWSTGMMFAISKAGVQVATWSIGQAYKLDLSDYTAFSKGISDRYQQRIVGPWGLADLAWLALIAYVAIAALRGKLGLAGGEFMMAIVMLGLANVLLIHQTEYMDTVSKVINLSSGSLFQIANDQVAGDTDGPDVEQGTSVPGENDLGEQDTETTQELWDTALLPLKRNIHIQFVERPWEYLNYGTLVDNLPGECKTRAQRIAAVGATGDQGWSWRYLSDAAKDDPACQKIVAFNRMPTSTRFLGALLTMLIGLVVSFTITMLGVTVLIAKITVALLFAIAPFPAAMAALPGAARRVSFLWATATLQCTAAAIGAGALLSMLLMAVDFVLVSTANDGQDNLLERWAIVLVLVGALYIGRKKMLSNTQQLAGRVADHLVRLSPAGAGWSGGGGGVDLLKADRSVATGARGLRTTAMHAGYLAGAAAIGTATIAGRTVQQRFAERRVARRNLNNLEIMKQRDEQPKMVVKTSYHPDGRVESRTRAVEQSVRTGPTAAGPPGMEGFRGFARRLDGRQRRTSQNVAAYARLPIDPRTGYLVNPYPGPGGPPLDDDVLAQRTWEPRQWTPPNTPPGWEPGRRPPPPPRGGRHRPGPGRPPRPSTGRHRGRGGRHRRHR